MKSIIVLDTYVNKHFGVEHIPETQMLVTGDKIVYELKDQSGEDKLSLGTYIGHDVPVEKKGKFVEVLTGKNLETYTHRQQKALKLFPEFKKEFKKEFPEAIPVTARYNIFSDMFYFYFYAETRFQFSDFVKRFREQTKSNFFLFQIGARDMIKLSPATDNLIGCNGLHLCCKSSRPLPSVEIESVILQNLEGRDIEKLKGRCGKLKCSLIYEVDTYIKEGAKFPRRGTKVEDSCGKCGFCTSFNIMTQEITARTQEGELFRFSLAELRKTYQELQPSMIKKEPNHPVAQTQEQSQ